MSSLSAERRTKIVCTLGPASFAYEVLERLIRAGLDVARLNFSHGTHESHREVYETLRRAEAEVGRPIAVLQDLQGPKIRLGKLVQPETLVAEESVILSCRNDFVGEGRRFPTTYERLARDVRPGEPILLADGRLTLIVDTVDGDEVHTRVEVGGTVSSNKGINLPGSSISAPSLTDKDIADLEFGLALGADYVALSFVRTAHDVRVLRDLMKQFGRVVPIISKIEKPEAVDNLTAIVDESDGIMVARGDLGVELPPEKVPAIQRRAIRMARARAKVTVVATQMLMSMTEHARPTSAEVSDVANAVFDGTDAVMLSDETAAGAYPVRAVETMAALAATAENAPEAKKRPDFVEELRAFSVWAVARAAVVTAEEIRASAIVSYTNQGLGPRAVGTWRPPCPILGCASSDEDTRRLALYWGVHPIRIPRPDSFESLVSSVEHLAVDRHLLEPGETVVITSKMPFVEAEHTNVLKLHTIQGDG